MVRPALPVEAADQMRPPIASRVDARFTARAAPY